MRQLERTQRSTEALLQASATVVAEGGLQRLTFDELAVVSGFSRGLVSARFGSKSGLTQALIDRVADKCNEAFNQLRSLAPNGLCCLLAYIEATAHLDEAAPLALWALLFEGATARSPIRSRVLGLYAQLRASLNTLIAAGQLDGSINPALDADHEASQLLAQLVGAGFQKMIQTEAPTAVDPFAPLVDLAHRRLHGPACEPAGLPSSDDG